MWLDLTGNKSELVQVMAWCHTATSHYLNQYWHRFISPHGITRPQWVKQNMDPFWTKGVASSGLWSPDHLSPLTLENYSTTGSTRCILGGTPVSLWSQTITSQIWSWISPVDKSCCVLVCNIPYGAVTTIEQVKLLPVQGGLNWVS